MSIASMIEEIAREAKEASRILKNVERRRKDEALMLMASRLIEQRDPIKAENAKDLAIAGERLGATPPGKPDGNAGAGERVESPVEGTPNEGPGP